MGIPNSERYSTAGRYLLVSHTRGEKEREQKRREERAPKSEEKQKQRDRSHRSRDRIPTHSQIPKSDEKSPASKQHVIQAWMLQLQRNWAHRRRMHFRKEDRLLQLQRRRSHREGVPQSGCSLHCSVLQLPADWPSRQKLPIRPC